MNAHNDIPARSDPSLPEFIMKKKEKNENNEEGKMEEEEEEVVKSADWLPKQA